MFVMAFLSLIIDPSGQRWSPRRSGEGWPGCRRCREWRPCQREGDWPGRWSTLAVPRKTDTAKAVQQGQHFQEAEVASGHGKQNGHQKGDDNPQDFKWDYNNGETVVHPRYSVIFTLDSLNRFAHLGLFNWFHCDRQAQSLQYLSRCRSDLCS